MYQLAQERAICGQASGHSSRDTSHLTSSVRQNYLYGIDRASTIPLRIQSPPRYQLSSNKKQSPI